MTKKEINKLIELAKKFNKSLLELKEGYEIRTEIYCLTNEEALKSLEEDLTKEYQEIDSFNRLKRQLELSK